MKSNPRRWAGICFALVIASFGTGCSTSFKYTPKHDQTYAQPANPNGLAIHTGEDARLPEEKRPAWAVNAEKIVARALKDEISYAKLFPRVKLHADSVNLKKYSSIVQFRVLKFECYNKPMFLENAGRDLLRFQGIRGALIAESIPSKYVSEVDIEFTVLDAATQQSFFTKKYSAFRAFTANGYQRETPKIEKTSEALSAVITQFVADLAKLPVNESSSPGAANR